MSAASLGVSKTSIGVSTEVSTVSTIRLTRSEARLLVRGGSKDSDV